MSDGTDSAGLDFDGDFAEGAVVALDAADKLADGLARLAQESSKVKSPQLAGVERVSAVTKELEQQVAAEAKIATFDANRIRAIDAAEKKYKAMKDAALGVKPKAEKGTDDDVGIGAIKLGTASGLAHVAGDKIFSAAIELGKAAVSLVKAGVELAIAETSKRQLQSAIFKDLGGDFDASIHLAAKYGIDEDKAVHEIKGLLNAKFSQKEIDVDIKVAAAIDLVKGEGKGAEYLEKLEKLKLEPKVSAKDIKGLAELGINTKDVYAELAKSMGVSVAEAEAKVKSGAVDTQKVLDAIEKTGEKSFGGIADKLADSIPALLGRAKAGFSHLFDDVDLSQVKGFLKNIDDVLEGPGGAAIKEGIKELFSTLSGLALGDFQGEAGKKKLEDFAKGVGEALHNVSDAIKEAWPVIKLIANLVIGSAKIALWIAQNTAVGKTLQFIAAAAEPVALAIGGIEAELDGIKPAFDGAVASAEQFVNELLGFDLFGDGGGIADGLVDGLVGGLAGGAARAVAAAVGMASDVLAAVKGVFDQHSPSAEFGDIGDNNAIGLANAMNDNATPIDAAETMADKTLAAAKGASNDNAGGAPGAAGAPVAGGAGAGITVIFAPVINPPAGSGAEVAAAVTAALAAAYPQFLAMVRRELREKAA